MLGGLLSAARVRASATLPQREALLWDLWDAANRVQGIDAGTAHVLHDLARTLGKPEPGRWLTAQPGPDLAALHAARADAGQLPTLPHGDQAGNVA